MTKHKAYILCRFADSSGLYQDWIDELSFPVEIVDEFLPDWPVPADAGLLITHMHYRWEELSFLRRIKQQTNIPILILCDGILEYRNTWDHPDLVAGSLFQPGFGHKLACLGRGQARILESWGNVGQCEIVGLPRLDAVMNTVPPARQTSGPFRLLIATANRPAFNQDQLEVVVQSLKAIQAHLNLHPQINGRQIEVNWRISDDLEPALGLPAQDLDQLPSLIDTIDHVDAVITTPSTLYLESILRDRPTALLDFHNVPQYIPAAWTISAAEHLPSVLEELSDPPDHKMLFQKTVLEDQLECRTMASPRLVKLAETMLAAFMNAESNQQPLRLPARILTDSQYGLSRIPEGFDLSTLYPQQKAFGEQEVDLLRIELAAAIRRLDQLPLELAEKNQFIAQLTETSDQHRLRIEDLHQRVVSLRERLGIQSED